jgi:Fe-S cluster assembly iron-binding protein IscA
MLTLTETARSFVRRIPDNPMLPPSAGLRISRHRGAADGGLQVSKAGEPAEGDQVLECDGARVFLGQRAVDAVQGKVLDAGIQDGRIQFMLSRPA